MKNIEQLIYGAAGKKAYRLQQAQRIRVLTKEIKRLAALEKALKPYLPVVEGEIIDDVPAPKDASM